jgi:hypothetical protein
MQVNPQTLIKLATEYGLTLTTDGRVMYVRPRRMISKDWRTVLHQHRHVLVQTLTAMGQVQPPKASSPKSSN